MLLVGDGALGHGMGKSTHLMGKSSQLMAEGAGSGGKLGACASFDKKGPRAGDQVEG